MSIHWPIIRRLARQPRRWAVTDDTRSWRAFELLAGAFHVAGEVERLAAAPHVGLLLPTSGVFPMSALGVWMLGKSVVPLNYLLKPEELQYVIDDSGIDTIVTVQPMLDFLDRAPRVRNLLRLEDIAFRSVPPVRWPALADDDDLAVLLYTSGTSGRPKGVMLTHGNITANMRQIRGWIDFTPRDSLMGVLPQFHVFGLTVLTLLPLAAGLKVTYSARFVPHRIVKLIREHRPTVFIAIPSMYNALLHVKDAVPEDFASLRIVVSGGEPLPEAVFQGFRERFNVTINEGFGMTETAPVTNWCRPHEWRPHSVGRALPEVVERIVDIETRRDLPPGADGELIIGGPNIMKGYYKLPAETAAAFDHGFLRTGDIGRIDDDGHLYITGRLKEMIIVGGENVFPREIEEVLNHHPAVGASGVIGLADPMRGEEPVAFVELKEGAAADPKALIVWCRERLAGYKVPRAVHIVAALPRNPTGKIVRRELRNLISRPSASSGPAEQRTSG